MSDYLLIHGDARKLPVDPSKIDAVISDPPYGMDWNTDSTRFTGGQHRRGDGRNDWGDINGDSKPFDPTPWVNYRKVVLWGWNHWHWGCCLGTTLIWVKKPARLYGSFLSDAEIAWMKGGHGVYCFEKQFPPPSRMAEAAGRVAHPTQKPISLMRWCIRKLNLEPDSLILDPYLGSGSTAIAALQEGHRFIGIDIEERYVRIAKQRIERPHKPIARHGKSENHPLFPDAS